MNNKPARLEGKTGFSQGNRGTNGNLTGNKGTCTLPQNDPPNWYGHQA